MIDSRVCILIEFSPRAVLGCLTLCLSAVISYSTDRDCETEGCGSVPGRNVREGKGVDLGPSPRSRNDWECGVDDSEPLPTNEGGETKRPGVLVLPAPTDTYLDFAFGLDGTADEGSERANGPLAIAGLDYPSALETLHHLESAIGLPTEADTNADPAPMNIDATLSTSIPQRLLSGGAGTRCRSSLNTNSLSLLPFHLSTSKPQVMGLPSSLSPVVTAGRDLALTYSGSSLLPKASVEVRPQTPRISVTVAGSALTPGFVESASGLTNPDSAEIQDKVFAGPSLFPDDGGME